MHVFGFASFNDLPPELQEVVKHHVDIHEMQHQDADHKRQAVLHSLDIEQLKVLRSAFGSCEGGPSGYMVGYMSARIEALGLCACGQESCANSTAYPDDSEEFGKHEPTDTATAEAELWDMKDDDTRRELMREYNIAPKVLGHLHGEVQCVNCGYSNMSLEDRMKRKPDECLGCQHKAAWG